MKVQQGSATINRSLGNAGIKSTVIIKRVSRKCNNQKYFQEVSQSKVLPGSAEIMGTASQYHKNCIQGVLQKYTKRVAQTKVLPGQSKEIPGSVTIRNTARDRHNQKYC